MNVKISNPVALDIQEGPLEIPGCLKKNLHMLFLTTNMHVCTLNTSPKKAICFWITCLKYVHVFTTFSYECSYGSGVYWICNLDHGVIAEWTHFVTNGEYSYQ